MRNTVKILVSTILFIIIVLGVCSCIPQETDTVVVPEGTKNAVIVRYVKNSDKTVTATVSVEGTVEYAAIAGTLNYDSKVLKYVSHEVVDCANVNNKEAGIVAFSQANSKNYTSNQTLFKVTFSYTEAVDTKLSFGFEEGNFTNEKFEDVQYTVIGNEIKLG